MRHEFLDSLADLLKSDDFNTVLAVLQVLFIAVSHRRRLCLKETTALARRGFAKILVPLIGLGLDIEASTEKNSNLTWYLCGEISRNACEIVACMAMGSEESINALVSADAFTVLREYITGPGTTFKMIPFQVKKLLR
jgi:hypothetical protein